MKKLLSDRWLHPLLLLLWIALGAVLRFSFLDSKPPWTDEFSTLVFSLGHSFRTVPLNQVISLAMLLEPLRPDLQANAADVVQYLMSESTHPPTYFVLAHEWMNLFPNPGDLVNLWVARAFPALLGVLSVPAIFSLGWFAFQSRSVAHLAAAMMAVSPYGIFLAQEARHYTLAILFVMASLACLLAVIRYLDRRTPVPLWLCLLWVVINGLGISVHYFFALTLIAEGIALLTYWLLQPHLGQSSKSKIQSLKSKVQNLKSNLWRISSVAAGTAIASLVWLPSWQQSYGSKLTEWIYLDDRSFLTVLNPIFQALAAWITMISLLPVESSNLAIILISGAIMIAFFVWVTPILVQGIKAQLRDSFTRPVALTLGAFVLGAIALFFLITYTLGTDLTRGARYNFVYFPAVILLVGASMATVWNSEPRLRNAPRETPIAKRSEGTADREALPKGTPRSPKTVVLLILTMGILSGITVVGNLGYQKYYRPDLFAAIVQQNSQAAAIIATTHRTHVQTGEMMGVARAFKLNNPQFQPQFVLAHQDREPQEGAIFLTQALAQQARPFDLWLVNFKADFAPSRCQPDPQISNSVDGYDYQLFHCTN